MTINSHNVFLCRMHDGSVLLLEWDENTGTYYSLQLILRRLFSSCSEVPRLVLRSDLSSVKLERLGMTEDQMLELDR